MLRRAGGYRHEFVPADDYDLWLRLLPRHRFAKLPDRLYSYRVHPQQLGATNADRQTRHAIRAKLEWLRRVEPGLPRDARLAATGSARGDRFYAQVAAEAGFAVVRADQEWDVLALTDFGALEASLEHWLHAGCARARGNLVVRDRTAAVVGECA